MEGGLSRHFHKSRNNGVAIQFMLIDGRRLIVERFRYYLGAVAECVAATQQVLNVAHMRDGSVRRFLKLVMTLRPGIILLRGQFGDRAASG
jgi:hypothetical protein